MSSNRAEYMVKKLIAIFLGSILVIEGINGAILAQEFESMEENETTSQGMYPLYRLYNPNSGEHFYTGDDTEKNSLVLAGWKYEGIGWYGPESTHTPVYRLYNKTAGDHHYTTDSKEKNTLVRLGWKYEGVKWGSDDQQRVPLYRVYNPNTKTAGSHHYTSEIAERNSLISQGWKNEGIAWYAVKDGK